MADRSEAPAASRISDSVGLGDSGQARSWRCRVVLNLGPRAESSGPDHRGCIGLLLEQSADPFDKAFARRFDIGADWQRLDVAAKIKQELRRTGAQLALRLGYFPQTVEIGGATLRKFDSSISPANLPQTPLTYRGRETDAPWRAEAEKRIERLRKSVLTVRVTDSAGKPISGATVQIRMLRHAFAFGSVYNDSRFPATMAASPDDLAYQQHYTELFNTGVDEAGMKWPSWQDPTARQSTLRASAMDARSRHRRSRALSALARLATSSA